MRILITSSRLYSSVLSLHYSNSITKYNNNISIDNIITPFATGLINKVRDLSNKASTSSKNIVKGSNRKAKRRKGKRNVKSLNRKGDKGDKGERK